MCSLFYAKHLLGLKNLAEFLDTLHRCLLLQAMPYLHIGLKGRQQHHDLTPTIFS